LIVADTNLIAGLYTESAQRDLAMAAYEKDQNWAAPYLWRSEFRNVMALYMRKELLELGQAIQITHWAEGQMTTKEYFPMASRVLNLASMSGCTAYDCEFVSLAEDLGLTLVTFDKKVLRAFPSIAVSPFDFVSGG